MGLLGPLESVGCALIGNTHALLFFQAVTGSWGFYPGLWKWGKWGKERGKKGGEYGFGEVKIRKFVVKGVKLELKTLPVSISGHHCIILGSLLTSWFPELPACSTGPG